MNFKIQHCHFIAIITNLKNFVLDWNKISALLDIEIITKYDKN